MPWRNTIEPQLRLGDLLVRAKLVTEKDIAAALAREQVRGGRLGDNLVAIGAIEQQVLDAFIKRIPIEPLDIAATGIDDTDLLSLLMKLIYTGRLEKIGQYVEALKLPQHIVMDLARMATERQLLYTLGSMSSDSLLEMRYALTDEGKKWSADAMQRSGYVGPAPVTLAEFVDRVNLQKPTNELITPEQLQKAIAGLDLGDSIVAQVGPALNAGRAMLIYGPPGNGKTSVALRFASVFQEMIHVPYAIIVQGQIIRFYDPRIHLPFGTSATTDVDSISSFRRETHDQRWVSCRRPFVVAGGELTLDMLDLRYDSTGHYYEAPLHMKALGGCFFIDDFGRQFVSPRDLLNRWIVPMENRVDYLKLRTGVSFSIPFEEQVIFATNMDPEDLMDPAFLRRLPYKIEIGPPNLDQFRRIFDIAATKNGLTLNEDVYKFILYLITEEKGLELAAFQPGFIVDQVIATCRFLGIRPELRSPYIEYAVNNLRVRRGPNAGKEIPHHLGGVQKQIHLEEPTDSFRNFPNN